MSDKSIRAHRQLVREPFRVYSRDEISESECKFDISPMSCRRTTCVDFGRRLMTAR